MLMQDGRAKSFEFFDRPHLTVARDLVGCTLLWDKVGGVVVEAEGYAVEDDPACHQAFRPSTRLFVATHLPGAAYVYINYGLHWLLNVLASDGIVLIRAIQPTAGIEMMAARRNQTRETALCSGPGKLGQALSLSPADHGSSLLTADRYVISRDALFDSSRIVADVRVGLSRAVDRPWRFLLSDNPDVSVPHGRALKRTRKKG